jgi:molybdopterin molybdotransferase
MISVEEAVQRIVKAFSPLDAERISIEDAVGRVLAEEVFARCSQPPFAVSSMDGYAVRAADVASAPISLDVIGTSPAGHPFAGRLGPNQAVRIFTGGVVPEGADAIVIQEDTDQGSSSVVIKNAARAGRHIRPAALDFRSGEVLVRSGARLEARHLALIAAGDVPKVLVRKRPRIAFAATGDELSLPGSPRGQGGVVASSIYSLRTQIEKWGGEPQFLGIIPDRIESIAAIANAAESADVLVTLGGASVGEHDLIQRALEPQGFALDFWKVAMRPGKPLIFGRLGATPLLGLPGNPVSSYVCSLLFLKPAIARMLGTEVEAPLISAKLVSTLPANDSRQDYMRARLRWHDGERWAEPFAVQDSSMQKVLADSNALIVRAPFVPGAEAGDSVSVILLD